MKMQFPPLFVLMILLISPVSASEREVSDLPRDSWGYVNEKGKVIISPQFIRAGRFMHGYAQCSDYLSDSDEGNWKTLIFVDKTGQQYKLDTDGYGLKTPDSAFEYFDVDGKHIQQNTFSSIWSVRRDWMYLQRSYDHSVSDIAGKHFYKLPPTWHYKGENPATGNIWCKDDNQAYEFTGATGKSKIPGFEPIRTPKEFGKSYARFLGFSEGLAAVKTQEDRWEYINADGKVQIELPSSCCNAGDFHEGLAAVSIGGRPYAPLSSSYPYNGSMYGFIDRTGRFAIKPTFPWLVNFFPEFTNGLAIGTAFKNADVAYGFINKKGKFVVPPVYKEVNKFSEGMAAVNAGPVGFDRARWISGYLHENRSILIGKFLRQFDFIGMAQQDVISHLGQPDKHLEKLDLECYILSAGCLGSSALIVRYESGRVSGYNVTNDWGGMREKLVRTSRKPLSDDDIFEFCKKSAN